VLGNILLGAFDHDIFAISKGRPDDSFMRECILVTQTPSQSNSVFQKLIYSPENSKDFVFVDRTADLKLAAQCMVAGRFGFNGSSSYSPDAVFIHEAVFTLLLTHLIPVVSSVVGDLNGNIKVAVPASKNVERRSKQKPSLEALLELGGVTLLFSGAKGAIVQADDRWPIHTLIYMYSANGNFWKSAFPTILQSQLAIASPVPLLLLCSVTSMDTAIDLATQYDNSKSPTNMPMFCPSAAFIFASPVDAQYLSNSVGADLTCINTIPAQLMVGPKLPKSTSSSATECDLTPRYDRHLFEERRVVFLKQSPAVELLGDAAVGPKAKQKHPKIDDWTAEVLLPLKPTGQPEGMRDDIFGMGIMITGSMIGVPLTIGLVFLGRLVFRQLSHVTFIRR
jgi:hypothetical protein